MAISKTASTIKNVIDREGNVVDFDIEILVTDIRKALVASGEGDQEEAQSIALSVISDLSQTETTTPKLSEIQDTVETELMKADMHGAAKKYILDRHEKARLRGETLTVDAEVMDQFIEDKQYFRSTLSEFIHLRTYSRWDDDNQRRETWSETVDRFMDFMKENIKKGLTDKEYDQIYQAMLNQEIMPSMRLLWSSGSAARQTNVAAYNCSYLTTTELQDFPEIMYILMCGSAVGFSVENKIIEQLPIVEEQSGKTLKTHVVQDTKEGWCDAFGLALRTWYSGKDVDFDYSKIRPKGARLSTMGGRAMGPGPLQELMRYTKDKLLSNQGKRLNSIEVHDLICKIGEIVEASGKRRAALISLSDLDDDTMRYAKTGKFFETEPQRSMANNSAVYNHQPSSVEFLEEWIALIRSNSGERGIFNRGDLHKQLPERRWNTFEPYAETAGTNPCGEIILRSKQFCNLTCIVARPDDTKETLREKIRLATILGTYQASLTKFPYLSEAWTKNCREEALLGVSITGYWDCKLIRDEKMLKQLRDDAVAINKKYAKKFGINQSTCVTSIKPSGNSSQLYDTSSGMHPRFGTYYIRRVRVSATDPLFRMLRDQGVPYHPEVGQIEETATTFVLEFPVKAPKGSVTKNDLTAIDLLEHWKMLKLHYTEHNPSVTVYVGDDEWVGVANWVYENWEIVGGLSFLPRNDHVYELAPYEEISKEAYDALAPKLEKIDFSQLVLYEQADNTTGAKEYACMGGGCEL
ncbi:ribonucleoside-triphosphate reductase [candidate division WWE3 bacterium]|uniref:Ribonucleoside-triphosphate reductase n=1 Tax=candidate division WWE3 bacterium TaxID=2053526 RepID=A0A955LGE6_UNCKA|nr:ribonucleoside-triphosphate reductase [candidate division WWE3 bacterium]